MKTPQGGKALQSAVYIVCYENVMENPKGFSQVPFWCKTYKSSFTSEFLDPLGKGKKPGRLLVTKQLKRNPQIPPGALLEFC